MFQIADKAMHDHTWMMSALAISRFDDGYREEVDNRMLSLGGKAHLYHRVRRPAHLGGTDSMCRSGPEGVFFQGFRFVRQHSMTTFVKVFIANNDDMDANQGVTRQARFCLTAVMQYDRSR
jgi:hypothetical protein